MSYPPPGYIPPAPVSREKVKETVVKIFSAYDISVTEARRCSANVELLKKYVACVVESDVAALEAVVKEFAEVECRGKGVKKVYMWSVKEGVYNYLNIGFFTKEKDATVLTMFSVGTG
ncbi:hypothetical protein HRbin01_01904 [archaeon HR01]|nr:hypothetical protein HRbin01_01904 [archaeon HR01]